MQRLHTVSLAGPCRTQTARRQAVPQGVEQGQSRSSLPGPRIRLHHRPIFAPLVQMPETCASIKILDRLKVVE
jgi:hypothetical protein